MKALPGMLLLTAIAAQERQLDPGPLLAFTEVLEAEGNRQDVLRVAEIEGSGTFELFRGKHGARVLRRLDRHRLLLELPDPERLVVADVASGVQRELVRGNVQFAGVRAGDVLFLVAPGQTGQLHSAPWRDDGMPVQLAEHAFSRVPLVVGNLAFAIDLEERGVWVVSLASGRSREVWSAPAGSFRLRIALSPNGQRLAIGALDRKHRGTLEVVDVGTGQLLHRWADLPIWVSPLSSSLPSLEVAFVDDEHIVCSETRGNPRAITGQFVHVIRSLSDGDVTDEAFYSDLGLQHETPRPPPATPRFEIARGKLRTELREVGSTAVLASIERAKEQWEDLQVSRPDGRFATARLGEKRDRMTLFLPGDAKPRQLSTGWAYGLTWLPAVR